MRFNFIKWKIKYNGKSCIEKTFKEAKEHMKNTFCEDDADVELFPIIMTDKQYEKLEDFRGW